MKGCTDQVVKSADFLLLDPPQLWTLYFEVYVREGKFAGGHKVNTSPIHLPIRLVCTEMNQINLKGSKNKSKEPDQPGHPYSLVESLKRPAV